MRGKPADMATHLQFDVKTLFPCVHVVEAEVPVGSRHAQPRLPSDALPLSAAFCKRLPVYLHRGSYVIRFKFHESTKNVFDERPNVKTEGRRYQSRHGEIRGSTQACRCRLKT
jgi:hypothetical protein